MGVDIVAGQQGMDARLGAILVETGRGEKLTVAYSKHIRPGLAILLSADGRQFEVEASLEELLAGKPSEKTEKRRKPKAPESAQPFLNAIAEGKV